MKYKYMEKHDICVIMLCIGNQYKYIEYVINSFNISEISINCFYILHYDSYYQYKSHDAKNIVNIDLENYEYNICKCFNSIKNKSKIWIVWDSTFFFNSDKKDDFKKVLNCIGVTHDIAYIYGANLCLDIYNYRENDMFSCKTGGCFVTSNLQQMDESNFIFTVRKYNGQKIKYELTNTDNYYFFNFAEAVIEDLMLIKCFKMDYVKYMYDNKIFLSFSHYYHEKTKSHNDSGNIYLLNNYIRVAKKHQWVLPQQLCQIYFYKFDKGCRSKIFTNTQYNDYSMTVVTLVRNNKHYLKESMGSLLNQTSSNWNCIIINDGSDEPVLYSDFLSKESIMHEKHFKIINLPEWNGLVKCHKLALMHSTNEIIGILDADDMLEEFAIEKVLNIYNSTKKDNIFVYTNFYICDENMNKISLGYGSNIKTCLLNDRCGNHFRTFKSRYYYLTSGFDDDLQFGGEDQDILFKMETVSQPIFLNDPLYLYRVPTNNSNTITSLKTITKYSLFISIFKNVYDRYNNLTFVLTLYPNKSKLKCRYKNIKNIGNTFTECYAEICSNNIYILDASYVIGIDKYVGEWMTYKKSKFNVNLTWDYKQKTFKFVDDNTLIDIKSFCKIHPSVYFNHVYILNLVQDIDKKNRIEKLFGDIGVTVEFVEAVYGKSEPYLSEFKNKYSASLRSPGAYGYSLTMIKIFNDAIEKRYKKILVCDDDIIFHKDFLNKFDEGIRKIPFDWKVLFFGLSGPWSGVNVNNDIKAFHFNKSFITGLENCDGSYCVGYDVNILSTLIDVTSQFDAPFDTAIIKYFTSNNISNIYAFYPYLVLADTTSSQIQFREKNTLSNFNSNQFRFKQNMYNFSLDTMINKNYDKFYNNPYPKVSLIMIIDKEGLKVNVAINSFINQTFDNLELIIIVHKSICNTQYTYLNNFLLNDNIVILKKIDGNFKDCLNVALGVSTGSVVGVISCDEYLLSEKISQQIKFINENDYIFVGCNIAYTEFGSIRIVNDDAQILNRANQNMPKRDHFGISLGISTLLFKRDMFNRFGSENSIFEFVKKVLIWNGQNFSSDDDIYDFLQNDSNDIYGKLDESLVIAQGTNSTIIIPKKEKKIIINNSQQLHQIISSITPPHITTCISTSIKKTSSSNMQSNYDIIMKLKNKQNYNK
jgi:glycosyltransferase involved in cell wall biosynthesis